MTRDACFAVVRGLRKDGKDLEPSESWSGVVKSDESAAAAIEGAPRGASSYFVACPSLEAAQAIVRSETARARVCVHGAPSRPIRPRDILVYTDGGCATMGRGVLRRFPAPNGCQNVSAAGYGVWFGEGFPWNAAEPLEGELQTPGRAEARALLAALEIVVREQFCARRMVIRMDADLTDARERVRKVRAGGGEDLANMADADIWERIGIMIEQLELAGTDIELEWVKGHAESFGNYRADELATAGIYAKALQLNPYGSEVCGQRRPFQPKKVHGKHARESPLTENWLHKNTPIVDLCDESQGIAGKLIGEVEKPKDGEIVSNYILDTSDVGFTVQSKSKNGKRWEIRRRAKERKKNERALKRKFGAKRGRVEKKSRNAWKEKNTAALVARATGSVRTVTRENLCNGDADVLGKEVDVVSISDSETERAESSCDDNAILQDGEFAKLRIGIPTPSRDYLHAKSAGCAEPGNADAGVWESADGARQSALEIQSIASMKDVSSMQNVDCDFEVCVSKCGKSDADSVDSRAEVGEGRQCVCQDSTGNHRSVMDNAQDHARVSISDGSNRCIDGGRADHCRGRAENGDSDEKLNKQGDEGVWEAGNIELSSAKSAEELERMWGLCQKGGRLIWPPSEDVCRADLNLECCERSSPKTASGVDLSLSERERLSVSGFASASKDAQRQRQVQYETGREVPEIIDLT